MARLRVLGGDGAEQLVEVGEGRLQIGRGRDNDVVLPDPQKGVSRAHAELRFENGHYVIVDLQSQNGTWIDGRRVERSEVPFGAEIAIGAYRLTLLNERAAARVTPRAAAADPLDEMRRTERYDAPPLATPSNLQPGGMPRWMMGAAAAAIAVVALAAVVWVSGRREGDGSGAATAPASSNGQGTADTSATPAPRAAESPATAERAAEPLDLPSESPSKRAIAPAPVSPPSGGGSRVTRRPGESTEAWQGRSAALHTRYGFSKAALDRGDFAAAAGGFEAILLEEPGFLDAPRLLVQAQSGLRANARSLYQAGRKLDEAGDWLGALQKYEQARQVHAALPGLSDSLQRVRGKLRAAGTAAFKQAQQHDKSGQVHDALKEYEKALQWLPADDPNRRIAASRVEQIRNKG